MSDLLHVSAQTSDPLVVKRKMRDVVIALLPAALVGIAMFGMNALLLVLTTIVSCTLAEYAYCKWMKKKVTTGDYSAVVTGLILGLNLPAKLPLWMAALGGVTAIILVKMLFGGFGQNFMNPALAARAILMVSFTNQMTNFGVDKINAPSVGDMIKHGAAVIDGVSSATPLQTLRDGASVDLVKMLIGNIGGSIGETGAIAILLGGLYLLVRKVITLRIPLAYLISFVVFILIFGPEGMNSNYILGQVLGGGLLLGIFFLATDPVTAPSSPLGEIIFGVALGLITGLFRILGSSAEGVCYAIIFCNLLVPLIDKVAKPKEIGKESGSNV